MVRRLWLVSAASCAAIGAAGAGFAQQDPAQPPSQSGLPAPAAPVVTITPAVTIEKTDREIVVQTDGTFVSTQTSVIKIERADAVRGASTVPIPVSSSLQSFELVEAYTETPDGKRLPVAPDSVITQAPPYAAQLATLSDMQLKVINFPGVSVGSKLHLTTRIRQSTPNFPGVFTSNFTAGSSTVIKDASVRIDMPKAMPLKADAEGVTALPTQTKGDRRVLAWRYAHTTFAPSQAGALSPLDDSPHLILTTLPDWAALATAYQARATDREQPSAKVKELAASITKGMTNDRMKAAALAMWVQRQVRYVNIVLDTGGFVPASADEVFDTRYGDCKGHATLLNALLTAAGIPSTSVLINSGTTYREPRVAGQIFNHMINYIPSLDMFVDTTNPFTSFGDLPEGDRGKFVVLTRSGETKRTPQRGPEPDGSTSDFTMTVTADGGIDGKTVIVPSGMMRATVRSVALQARSSDPRQLAANVMRSTGSPGTGTIAFSNPDGPDASIRVTGDWHVDDAAVDSGTGAMRLPYGIALASIPATAANGTGSVPTTSLACGGVNLVERFAITFPSAYTITSVPTGTKIDTAELNYASNWVRDGQTIRVTRTFVTHYPSLVCSPDLLARLQQAKRQVIRDTNAQIVYTRKGSGAA